MHLILLNMNISNCSAPTTIQMSDSHDTTKNIFRIQENSVISMHTVDQEIGVVSKRTKFMGDEYSCICSDQSKLQASDADYDVSPLTKECDESTTLKCSIVSFSLDEDDASCNLDSDMTMPLDYRTDWSQEVKSALQQIFISTGTFLVDDVDEESSDCKSIESFEINSENDELECQPLSEWMNCDDVIW